MERVRQRDQSHAWYLLADFLAIVAAYYTAMLLRFHSEWGGLFFAHLNRLLGVRESAEVGRRLELFYAVSAPRLITILAVTLFVLYALRDLYAGWRFIGRRPVAWHVIAANALALVAFYTYFYLSRNVFHPRSFFFTVIVLNAFFCVAFRGWIDVGYRVARQRFGLARCRVLLIGNDASADFVDSYLRAVHPHGLEVAGRIASPASRPFGELLRETEAQARRLDVGMIVSAERRFEVAEIMRLLDTADTLDIPVKVLSDKLDVLMNRARQPVDLVHGLPLVHFEAPGTSARFDRLRRHVSLLLAALGLVVALPLMLVVAGMIRLTSPGGILFIQERMGVNRRPFRMFKFRTMRDRADEMLAQVEEFNESGGGLFKIRRDPRVTPIGRFLRRFSLDELPQLINVIRGDMLMVGPRPLPRRDFENYYEEWHYGRHSGMPGLTCLWQVSGRSDIDFHNMCILDVYYLRNRSWALDARILLRTAWVVLFAKGAY